MDGCNWFLPSIKTTGEILAAAVTPNSAGDSEVADELLDTIEDYVLPLTYDFNAVDVDGSVYPFVGAGTGGELGDEQLTPDKITIHRVVLKTTDCPVLIWPISADLF
ncbi:MAG: hypothetical protein WBB01_19080 [Phormidesmis sp.]